jgi:hypothetical protein
MLEQGKIRLEIYRKEMRCPESDMGLVTLEYKVKI